MKIIKKPKKNQKRTPKQEKALKNLMVADGCTLASAMVKAGYSKKTAHAPIKFTESPVVKPEIDKLISALEEERNAVIERLKKTRNMARYRDLMDGLDKLTKNIQLLSGKATENVGFSLGDLMKAAEAREKQENGK